MVQIRRLGPQIGAEIRGVDVRALDDAGFAAIYRAWLDHNVVVVPGQELTIEQFLRLQPPLRPHRAASVEERHAIPRSRRSRCWA